MKTDAEKRAQKKYDQKITTYVIKLNPDHDSDLIEYLGAFVGNRNETLKKIIREHMKKIVTKSGSADPMK